MYKFLAFGHFGHLFGHLPEHKLDSKLSGRHVDFL
jgi:hypothetical protein